MPLSVRVFMMMYHVVNGSVHTVCSNPTGRSMSCRLLAHCCGASWHWKTVSVCTSNGVSESDLIPWSIRSEWKCIIEKTDWIRPSTSNLLRFETSCLSIATHFPSFLSFRSSGNDRMLSTESSSSHQPSCTLSKSSKYWHKHHGVGWDNNRRQRCRWQIGWRS